MAPETVTPVKVLIVDDDEEDYELIRTFLENGDMNLRIDWACNVDEARPMMLSNRHDLYLVDQRIGGDTGVELLREMHEGGFSGKVILVSGIVTREAKMDAFMYGVRDVLSKQNLSTATLMNSVHYVLERASKPLPAAPSAEDV